MEIIQNKTKLLAILLVATIIFSICIPIFATEEQISNEVSNEISKEISNEVVEEPVKDKELEEKKEDEPLRIFNKLKTIVLDKDFMSNLLNKLKNAFAKVIDFFRRLLEPEEPVKPAEEEFKIEINIHEEAIDKAAKEYHQKGYKVIGTNENEYYLIVCAGEKSNSAHFIKINDTKFENDILTVYVIEDQTKVENATQEITYPYCIAKYNKEIKKENIKIIETTENSFGEM